MQHIARRDQIANLIRNKIAEVLHCDSSDIEDDQAFTAFGINSIKAIGMSLELADDLKTSIPPTIFYEYENISELSDYLAKHQASLIKKSQTKSLKSTIIKKQSIKSHDHLPEIKALHNIKHQLTKIAGDSLFFIYPEDLKQVIKNQKKEFINFSKYDYLGLAINPKVKAAAIAAIKKYGNSVSASRLAGGQIQLHHLLEKELADFIGTEDCVVFNSGHATNVNTIGCIMNHKDMIILDEYAHNSMVTGAKLSNATIFHFKHNDMNALKSLLERTHPHFDRIMIAVEGLYSMDGDMPDLPTLLELKKRYRSLLYLDEAHSLGILGKTGRGITEHFNVDPKEVDFIMSTGKTFGTVMGYIAARQELIEYIKYSVAGFVYSVGLNPASTAAALKAVQILKATPKLPQQLREKSIFFIDKLRAAGIDCGNSYETPIVPIIIGSSEKASKLCIALRNKGIFAPLIIYPAVPDHEARLRLFINNEYSKKMLSKAADVIIQTIEERK